MFLEPQNSTVSWSFIPTFIILFPIMLIRLIEKRKICDAFALKFSTPPRAIHDFLSTSFWNYYFLSIDTLWHLFHYFVMLGTLLSQPNRCPHLECSFCIPFNLCENLFMTLILLYIPLKYQIGSVTCHLKGWIKGKLKLNPKIFSQHYRFLLGRKQHCFSGSSERECEFTLFIFPFILTS